MIQTLICVECLTGNRNSSRPYRLLTFERIPEGSKSGKIGKSVIEIPPGFDSYNMLVEATRGDNRLMMQDGSYNNPIGQTIVKGKLLCAIHAMYETGSWAR